MKVFGIDFTSAPSRKKPITCAHCQLKEQVLHVDYVQNLGSLNEFEVFLKSPGPWIAGFDFPFGQPHRLIKNLNWPTTWAGYVQLVATMEQTEFESALVDYRHSQPQGDKYHLRATDITANALSPMMLQGVPVGKMFFKGAPRLLRAGLNICPCHPTSDNRIALETYPALITRAWLGKRSYKTDTPVKQTTDQQRARHELLSVLTSPSLPETFGFTLALEDSLAQALSLDPTADTLDALLCAIQAAWAYTQPNFGIPEDCNPVEGWIVHPYSL